MIKTISIIGLGYLGLPLGKELKTSGKTVRGTTRSPDKAESFQESGIQAEILTSSNAPSAELLRSEVLVLNIPPSEGQLEWFKSWNWDFSKRIIFVSSTSVYKPSEGVVHEDSEKEMGILSMEEEWIATHFENHVILRAGGILGPDRHPGQILSGRKNISKANHPVNLIHVEDLRGIILKLLDSDFKGVINVVSDEHHKRKEFYQDFCRRNNLPLPEFDEEDLSEGKTVSNERLKTLYTLSWPTIFGKDP